MEPARPQPNIVQCCANCLFWEPTPDVHEFLGFCSHEFWGCHQDSRYRCLYFKLGSHPQCESLLAPATENTSEGPAGS